MQLRFYTDIVPEIVLEECQEKILEQLGLAETRGQTLSTSGIVTNALLKTINPPDRIQSKMESIVENHKTFELFEDSWLSFNYMSRKTQNQRTTQGTLYKAGLYPRQDSISYETTTLVTVGLCTNRAFLIVLTNAGRSTKDQFDDLVLQIAGAVKSSAVPHLVDFNESQLKKLAKIYMDENHSIASSTTDALTSTITISNIDDIFNDSLVQQADSILEVTRKIQNGEWKSIMFRVKTPGYYLIVSKSSPNSMTLIPMTRTDVLDKGRALPIFDHILSRLIRIERLSTYQSTFSS